MASSRIIVLGVLVLAIVVHAALHPDILGREQENDLEEVDPGESRQEVEAKEEDAEDEADDEPEVEAKEEDGEDEADDEPQEVEAKEEDGEDDAENKSILAELRAFIETGLEGMDERAPSPRGFNARRRKTRRRRKSPPLWRSRKAARLPPKKRRRRRRSG